MSSGRLAVNPSRRRFAGHSETERLHAPGERKTGPQSDVPQSFDWPA
jgi:hypothetical protein